MHCPLAPDIENFPSSHSQLDSALHSPAALIAAMVATSLSLTAHHYNLQQEGKQRDLLLFGVVGSGVVTSLVLGLDGTAILLRVVPWFAILAFLLSSFPVEAVEGVEGRGTQRVACDGLWV